MSNKANFQQKNIVSKVMENKMQTIQTIQEMQNIISQLKQENKTIGFVPTMGFLHHGHLSLIKKAREENDITILSIYVNPTQFNNPEDLEKYPRNFKQDQEQAEKEKVDYIFYPNNKEMYPNGQKPIGYTNKFMKGLCASTRPGHFEGVVTIVSKLFNIIQPTKTYFGQKDYQQSLVIKQMIKDLNYNIEFVMCPLIREPDGVAMSSRNAMLTKEQRNNAIVLFKSLLSARELIQDGETNTNTIKENIKNIINNIEDTKINYIEIRNSETLENIDEINGKVIIALAVFFGKVRLIDNILN